MNPQFYRRAARGMRFWFEIFFPVAFSQHFIDEYGIVFALHSTTTSSY